MKKLLCCVALVAALIPFAGRQAAAQDIKVSPVPALSWIMATHPVPGTLTIAPTQKEPAAPPYCNPCLFYGGDFDSSSSEAQGIANTNSLLVPETTVYVPFAVPGGQRWQISGLFTNDLATDFQGIDPMQSTWSISSGVSGGTGGTVIASGTASASFNPTGRSGFGFNEFTDLVRFSSAVTLGPGIYWLSVVPQCTNTGNSLCSSSYYFLSNTQQGNHFGPYEPEARTFINSSFFGYNYLNVCDVTTIGCRVYSAGVLGKARVR